MNKITTLTMISIAIVTSILIPTYAYEGQQTQTVKGYKITFSTNPEQPVIGLPAELLFEVMHAETGDYVVGSHAVVHVYGPGIHRILETSETPGLGGHYHTDYTFPLEGSYNIALETAIKGKEIWAFFKLTFGQPPSSFTMVWRLVLSAAIAVLAILGMVLTVRLSGKKKLLISLFIIFVSLSFALTVETRPTQPMAVVYVLDESGNPISDVLVTISGPFTASDVTDGGYCIFRNIPAGTYSITASAEGYITSAKEETVEAGQLSYIFVFLANVNSYSIIVPNDI